MEAGRYAAMVSLTWEVLREVGLASPPALRTKRLSFLSRLDTSGAFFLTFNTGAENHLSGALAGFTRLRGMLPSDGELLCLDSRILLRSNRPSLLQGGGALRRPKKLQIGSLCRAGSLGWAGALAFSCTRARPVMLREPPCWGSTWTTWKWLLLPWLWTCCVTARHQGALRCTARFRSPQAFARPFRSSESTGRGRSSALGQPGWPRHDAQMSRG